MGIENLSWDNQQSQQKVYEHIEQWYIRSLIEEYPYIDVDSVFLKRS